MMLKIPALVFGLLVTLLLRWVLKIGRDNVWSRRGKLHKGSVAVLAMVLVFILIFGAMFVVLYAVREHSPEFKLDILLFALMPILVYLFYFIIRFTIPDMIRMDKGIRNP
jgi:hypothetical protein